MNIVLNKILMPNVAKTFLLRGDSWIDLMKATIIYDNTVFRRDLQADWGFSALIEAGGKRILFDTGASGSILLSNMSKLGIIPQEIDDVIISHAHFDHTGGLSAFLDQNNEANIWAPSSFRGVKNANAVIAIKNSRELYEGIYSTGELEGIEQCLCIQTLKGIVIIAGCSHPRMAHIIGAASEFGKVYGIIGGLHGNRPESLKNLDLICATHCTQFKKEIASLYPKAFIEGGAGKIIND
jgi:7,8-dihydropterin-6-yl-methyl-4-(beta-D-ribofuranosyl)aminobenzene 5'-phosphate synthase